MVFVVTRAGDDELCTGLRPEDAARLRDAIEFVREPYTGKQVPTGQDAMAFSADGVAALHASKSVADPRSAGMFVVLTPGET